MLLSFIKDSFTQRLCILLCCADCAMIPLSFVMDFPTNYDAFVLSSFCSHTPLIPLSIVNLEE